MKADNENDELSFISIAAATANVVRYLQLDEKQNEESQGNAGGGDKDEQRAKEHREYVERKLRDYATFERRYINGGKKNRI